MVIAGILVVGQPGLELFFLSLDPVPSSVFARYAENEYLVQNATEILSVLNFCRE